MNDDNNDDNDNENDNDNDNENDNVNKVHYRIVSLNDQSQMQI